MPDPLDLTSAERLADEAERLAGAASSGPWEYSPRLHGIPFQHHIWRKHGFAIAQMLMTSDLDEDFPEQASKNGPFIAASRTLVPQLASALRQAVARVRELERDAEFDKRRWSDIPEYAGFTESETAWWSDKPHQVVRELRRKLTEAEHELYRKATPTPPQDGERE